MSRVETQQSAARAVVQAPAQEAPQKQGISARWKSFRNRVGNKPLAKKFRRAWRIPEVRFNLIVGSIILIVAGYFAVHLWGKDQYAPFATLLVGTLAGIGALANLVINYYQRQRHFEHEAHAKRFADLQNRLASDKPHVVANAIRQMREIALQKRAYAPDEFSKENYPFFEQVIVILTTTLEFTEDNRIRETLIQTLNEITNHLYSGNSR